MPAPELTVKVPGETADTAAAAASTTATAPPDERLAAVLTLSKQTVAAITEALPGLVAGDLIALRDLEVAGDNRKGVLAAIEFEDKRREELAKTADTAAGAATSEAEQGRGPIVVPDYVDAADANRLYGEAYGVDWAYEGGAYVPLTGNTNAAAASAQAATVQPRTAGQATLTAEGWVVPEPQPKG